METLKIRPFQKRGNSDDVITVHAVTKSCSLIIPEEKRVLNNHER